tara:strand:- start:12 stop:356 length:345 start_codon:yes stop_codon:yes gene_type:complete
MQIGELDRVINIENYSASQDSYGEQVFTWSNLITVWAKMEFRGGNVKDENNDVVATKKVIFTIRNQGGLIDSVNETMRVAWGNRGGRTSYFMINDIKEVGGRNRFLELETEKKL